MSYVIKNNFLGSRKTGKILKQLNYKVRENGVKVFFLTQKVDIVY